MKGIAVPPAWGSAEEPRVAMAMCAYSGSVWNEDGERGKRKNWLLVPRNNFGIPALTLAFLAININRGKGEYMVTFIKINEGLGG